MEYIHYLIDFVLHIDVHLAALVAQYGIWVYAILFVIVFCETGLVVTPFLPGDSLLFVAGALAALPTNGLNVHLLALAMAFAAVLGDASNYEIGRLFGTKLFRNPNSKIFKQSYLEKTHAFYDKYGGKTIVIARFVPVVRTFAPFVAGMGKKEDKIVRKTFLFRRQIITFVMILQTNMKALLLVGAGGFAGSALRYLISRLMLPWAVSSGFPFSTLTVNVAGSLLIGALMGLGLSGGWALLCIVGFCGGFTTFSTFSLETVTLLRAGSYLPAALYMWSSMVLSIAAVCGGYYLGTKFNTFE